MNAPFQIASSYGIGYILKIYETFAKTFRYLIVIQLFIVTIWSVAFYYSMMHEIYDSIDDGLDNYKLLIIKKQQVTHPYYTSPNLMKVIMPSGQFRLHKPYPSPTDIGTPSFTCLLKRNWNRYESYIQHLKTMENTMN